MIISIKMSMLKFLYFESIQTCLNLTLFFTSLYIFIFPTKWNLSPLTIHITSEMCVLSTDFLPF